MSQANDQSLEKQHIRESVSALMDGEAQELELRRLMSQEDGAAVNESWQRYHLVRDVMTGGELGGAYRHLDISAQVSAAIAEEGSLKAAGKVAWLKPVAGFAVAASVAMGVVLGVQGVNQTLPGSVNPLESAPAVAGSRVYPVVGASMQASAGDRVPFRLEEGNAKAPQLPGAIASSQAAAQQEAQLRLEKYLLQHTESASLNNGQGMMSFARVVNFDSE